MNGSTFAGSGAGFARSAINSTAPNDWRGDGVESINASDICSATVIKAAQIAERIDTGDGPLPGVHTVGGAVVGLYPVDGGAGGTGLTQLGVVLRNVQASESAAAADAPAANMQAGVALTEFATASETSGRVISTSAQASEAALARDLPDYVGGNNATITEVVDVDERGPFDTALVGGAPVGMLLVDGASKRVGGFAGRTQLVVPAAAAERVAPSDAGTSAIALPVSVLEVALARDSGPALGLGTVGGAPVGALPVDGGGSTSGLSAQITFSAMARELVAAAEVALPFFIVGVAANEPVQLADAPSKTLASWQLISENAAPTDSSSANFLVPRGVIEIAVATDSPNGGPVRLAAGTEAVAANDSSLSGITPGVLITEMLAAGDASSSRVIGVVLTVEVVAPTDAADSIHTRPLGPGERLGIEVVGGEIVATPQDSQLGLAVDTGQILVGDVSVYGSDAISVTTEREVRLEASANVIAAAVDAALLQAEAFGGAITATPSASHITVSEVSIEEADAQLERGRISMAAADQSIAMSVDTGAIRIAEADVVYVNLMKAA